MRNRTGEIIKRKGRKGWYARVRFVDRETGKVRAVVRAARTKAEAAEERDKLLREIGPSAGTPTIQFQRKTFGEWAAIYSARFVKPAEYAEDRKIAGYRSVETARMFVRTLEAHFGARRIREISYEDLRSFKIERLSTLTRYGGRRSIASVNRELSFLKRMLKVAMRDGWVLRNPFDTGEPLISPADEKPRETILTRDEEARLLAACDNEHRRHLKAIIICALDTGMRQGEIFKLRWRDVDLQERRMIRILAFNTKTMQERQVAITTRLYRELRELKAKVPGDGALVFGVTDTVKRSFGQARRAAGLEGLRFHDLRHSCATRLVRSGLSLPEVGRILGHTNPRTTYRYVNADESTAREAAAALDAYGQEKDVIVTRRMK